ncbi:hypothetical protein PENTCL1PPCAC_29772, partial [Pristionchus entomophagus]
TSVSCLSSSMRSLLALTLVVGAAQAAGAPRHTLTPNYYEHLEAEAPEAHHRAKRAIGGFRSPCPEGWTGQFCESPICGNQQQVDPYETDTDKMVDVMYLPEGCTGEYYVPYDSTTNLLTISITTDEMTKATAVLTNPNGEDIVAISSQHAGKTATFKYKSKPNPYVLTIKMDAHTDNCLVHIEAQSTLTFNGGWVSSPMIDNSPFGESMYNSKPQYFIAHPFNLAMPHEIKTVTVRQARLVQPDYRSVLSKRFDCAYEFYAGMFQCKGADSQYVFTIEGVDSRGYAFRRSRPFMCLQDDTQPTFVPPVSTAAPKQCSNGGSLLHNDESNTDFCFCPELMTGKECESVLCMNGGLPLDPDGDGKMDICDCLPGFVGKNCDSVVCDPDVGKLLTDTKTLAVVVRNTASMKDHIDDILNAIDEEVLHHMIDGRNVYDGFILAYIRDGVTYAKSYNMQPGYAQFGKDLSNLATRYSSDVSCTDSLVPAIEAVYSEKIMDQSPIFIFTDAMAEPTDSDRFKDIMRLNSANRMQLHTVYMNTQANCKKNPRNEFYHDLARYTAGLVHQPPSDKMSDTFQNAMRATTYKMNLVESADLKTCAMKSKSIIVDVNSENLIIAGTGNGLTITLTDPNWEVSTLRPSYTDGYSSFFAITSPMPGEYIYAVQGEDFDDDTPCSYRFYSQSDFDLFLGTTSNVNIDERTFEPVVGQAAHLIAQINGFYGGYVQDQFRLFAEILITSPDEDDKHQPLYYSNGIFRSSCGFHLYFGVANFCKKEDQIFYATVFVDDENGFPVQRSAVGYCNAADVDPSNPDDCQNGGVRTNETTCWCPAHFTGSLCQTPQCLNGGKLSDDQTWCICPGGTTGKFCEMMECTTRAEEWEASFDHRTLNFVVSTRFSMKETVKKLADEAATFAGYYELNHKNWIDHFAIVTVNQTGADLHMVHNANDFAATFREISDNFDSYTDYDNDNCTVMLNQGVSTAISASYDNSQIFVFADSQAENLAFPDILRLLDRADELELTVTMFGTSYDMCDGSGTFGDQEGNVVAFTGGKTFYTDNLDRVFDYVDTFYYSGVILEKSFDKCNEGVAIDFPLEASAHSVVVTVEAEGAGITMKVPNGFNGLYHDDLIKGKQFYIQQFIQACPDSFDTVGNMCYLFKTDPVQWITSLVGCGSQDKNTPVSMITIFNDDKHDQILQELGQSVVGVWLALFRNDQGDWIWYQAGAAPVPLDAYLKKYFAPNQPWDDLNKKYVYMMSDGLWYPADTTELHWTMCQRTRYGGSYNPEEQEPDLPPGFWNLQVTSSSASCTVNVRTQSDVQIAFGFSQNPHDDYKRGTANVDSPTNYVVAKAVGLDTFDFNPDIPEGKIDYATIAAEGADVYPLAMTSRYAPSCTFDTISQISFACPTQQSLSEIVVKFQGIDQFGYSFERALVTRCDTYATRCDNGGFANNGECVCPPHFNGDDCSKLMCENGGTPLFGGTCQCPPLYTGKFCELAMCDPPLPDNFKRDGRTLVIMLETSFFTATPIWYLANSATNLADSLRKLEQKRPGWFDFYVIIPFDSTSNKDKWGDGASDKRFAPLLTNNIDKIDEFLDAIPTAECPGDNLDVDPPISCPDTQCPRPIGSVLSWALDQDWMTNPDSVAVVITNSGIEDHNDIYEITPKLIQSKVQLHFLISPSATPCSLGWDDEMNKAMTYMASFSSGTVTSVVAKNLGKFFSDFLPSMYKAQEVVIDSQYVKQCDAAEHVFQIDHSASEFNLQFLGVEAETMNITGPLGDVIVPPNLMPGSSAYFGVFEVDNQLIVPGTYIVRTSSVGTQCDLKVRSTSAIIVDIGFTQIKDSIGGNSQDDAHYAGVYGVQNKLMFHVEGMDMGGALTYAQIVSPMGQVIATRSVFRRDSACTYTFVMDGSFSCDYTDIEVVVYGVDWQNSPFHRNFKAHCTDNRPRPDPPAQPTCDLSAMKADIGFILDSSVDQQTMNWFQTFVTMMISGKFTLGHDNTQIAVMTLSDVPKEGGYFSFLFGADKNTFVQQLGSIHPDGHTGQNITSVIPALMGDIYTKQNAFRQDDKSVKKLLVYLTGHNPTDVDPVNAINALIENKITGVAVASYKIGNPSKALKSLVDPGCIFDSGADGAGFSSVGYKFMWNLLCMTQPICGIPPTQ